MTPYMYTFTGKKVNPLDVDFSSIDIKDIAHHLSLINRFNGASSAPISVAQHSVYVAKLCRPWGLDVELQALLHDASEAYLGDITKWLKQSAPFTKFREIEELLQLRIWSKFGCDTHQHHSVSEADKLMVRFEMEAACVGTILTPGTEEPHPDYPLVTDEEKRAVGSWYPWPWRGSEDEFHMTFQSIQRRLGR